MDLFARSALLLNLVSSQQESPFSQFQDSRNLAVTCVLTDIAYSMGDNLAETMGNQQVSASENMKYIMHGNHVDTDGKMFVVGTSKSSQLKSGETNENLTDAVAMRIDEEGILNWFTSIGSNGNDYPGGITVERTWWAYVIGTTEQSEEDIFLVKLGRADGGLVWKKQFGRTGTSSFDDKGLNVDFYSNYLYCVGQMFFDSTKAEDGIIFKVDTDGALQWMLRITTVGPVAFSNVFADSSGVYALGSSNAAFSQGDYDIVQTRASLTGSVIYSKSMGAANIDLATDFEFFGSWEFICGYSTSPTEVAGEIGLSRSGDKDVFVMRLRRSSMDRDWGRFIGTSGSEDISLDCVLDDDGNVYGTMFRGATD